MGDPSETLAVEVKFDALTGRFTYSGDITAEGKIVVSERLAWVQFTLETTNLATGQQPAAFLVQQPVTWQGAATPPEFQLWLAPAGQPQTALVIEDHNLSESGDQVFGFVLNVLFGTDVHTSPDPAIVNRDIPDSAVRPQPAERRLRMAVA
jgi:hypothetical protein